MYISQTWNQTKCPSTDKWMKKMWYTYTMKYSVQLLSHEQLSATLWTAGHQASLSKTNSQSLLKIMCIESVMSSNHLILCHPPILPSIRVFSSESTLRMRWPKYWSFSSSIIPFKEIPGLISFTMGWLDLLAVQGTLKSLLQHHSSKASIFWLSEWPKKTKNLYIENYKTLMKEIKMTQIDGVGN